ncbi:MAG: hypothetical protein M1821_005229 [Bathelium mastoideum]|nr:MAG: hypothetical protein M1821_005229 [Bathelium mastoideum]
MAEVPDFLSSETLIDEEIAQILQSLDHRHSLLRTTLLSHRILRSRLTSAQTKPSSRHHRADSLAAALRTVDAQLRLNTSKTYRACAGATCFAARDPDPAAVDSGRVLGVRIDVLPHGKGKTYVMLLHRPQPNKAPEAWRVHRHTLPPAVGLEALLARYLPFPHGVEGAREEPQKEGRVKRQDLVGLVRAIRRAVMGWRRRVDAIEALKEEVLVGDEERRGRTTGSGASCVKRVWMPDEEGREAKIEWKGGLIASLRIRSDGVVEKCTVRDANGAERTAGSRLLMGTEETSVASLGDRIRELPGCLDGKQY